MTWWIVKCNIHGYYHMTFKCKIMHVTVRSQSQPTLGFSSSALPSFSSSSSSARAAATSGSRGIPYSTFALLACVRKVKDEAQGTKSNLDSNLLGRTQDFSGKYSFSCPFQSRDSWRPRRLKCCVLVWTTTLCHDQYFRLLNKPGIVGLPSSL